MNIFINSEKLEFHIQNKEISYIIKVLENGEIGHLYFGKALKNKESFEEMSQIPSRSLPITPYDIDQKPGFCLDLISREYPTYGTGDYREPAIIIKQKNGSRISTFKYKKYEIIEGKEKISGLPATYVENNEEAKTLKIYLEDEVLKASLILNYTIFRDYSAITRGVSIENLGDEDFEIERILSSNIDFHESNFEVMHLSGTWARETNIMISPVSQNKIVIDSKRGTSSANANPFVALKRSNTDEFSGEIYGFNLIYSGNFIAQVEKNQTEQVRVNMGINDFNFSWKLKSNEKFCSPEVVMVYSDNGINNMSRTFHNLYRTRLCRGEWRDKVRPILINNWEATYFDFTEEKILEIAKKSKKLGIELFVLDDGWFGKRNSDKSGLGDWWTNLEKIPSGISGLSKKIKDLGMNFGLWFEPEMVNKDSELYREHPNWILQTPDRKNTLSRNQCTLDLGREDVREYLYKKISEILSSSDIDYVKWDMNRPMTEIWSEVISPENQGETGHRYILGLYELLEKLVSSFPHILFESCASGGNRMDGGMLYYMPQAWISDNTDAIQRLKIQYGTSIVYPISSMGSHVSAAPNHQTGRVTSIKTRGNVAMFGAFGYELDLNKITDYESEIVKKQVEYFKKNRELIQFGEFVRLSSPFENNFEETAWMVISPDKERAIYAKFDILFKSNPNFKKMKLANLNKDFYYEIKNSNISGNYYYGDELIFSGLRFKDIQTMYKKEIHEEKLESLDSILGDFQSRLIEITKKEN